MSWIPKPEDIVECEECGSLKVKGEKCASCAQFPVLKLLKFKKPQNGDTDAIIVEERIFRKKNSTRYRRRIFEDFFNVKNIKSEYIDWGIPWDDPKSVVVKVRGGIHVMAFQMNLHKIGMMFKKGKALYKLITGKRYYHRIKQGRPKRKVVDI